MTVTKVLVSIVVIMGVILILQFTGIFPLVIWGTPKPSPAPAPEPSPAPAPELSPKRYSTAQIGFTTTRNHRYQIYAINADGSGERNLINNGSHNYDPSWSPDGTKIAFASCQDDGENEIYVMDANGSNLMRLTHNPANDVHPTWSPDGKKIAFESHRDGSAEIYVMNSDGSNQTRLTYFPVPAKDPGWRPYGNVRPCWSPNSNRIAFEAGLEDLSDSRSDIYIINADGTNKINLTNDHLLNNLFPSWSPDGRKILYTCNWGIWVMNTDGSNKTRLISSAGLDFHATWSPDGSKIAFSSDRDGNSEIYVADADGNNQTRITHSEEDDYWPVWSTR